MKGIKAQALGHGLGKKGKATRYQDAVKARLFGGTDPLECARVGSQSLVQHLLQGAGGDVLQNGHSTRQALVEVLDLATHGGLGNGGDLGLLAAVIGDLIDALDVDDRGVHVHGQHREIRQGLTLWLQDPVHPMGLGQFGQAGANRRRAARRDGLEDQGPGCIELAIEEGGLLNRLLGLLGDGLKLALGVDARRDHEV